MGSVKASAKQVGDNVWKINGTKTFITTPQSHIHLVLARPEGAPAGTKGIGLFLIPMLKDDGSHNGVEIAKLEHKLGINASATGEVVYNDSEGYAVGDPSSGFKYMLTLMNISRLKVGTQSLGIMRRSFLEAAKYASVREQFGTTIDSFPLVRELLTDMAVDVEAMFAFIFRNAYALDKNKEILEEGGDPKNKWARLARIMTPQSKNTASAWGVKNGSKCIQVFGGYGYSKEFEAERMLRDAQIMTLYEGTNEIQVMDVMRAIAKEDVLPVVKEDIDQLIGEITHSYLQPLKENLLSSWKNFEEAMTHISKHPDAMNYGTLMSRRVAEWMTHLHAGAILLKEAQDQINAGDGRKALVAKRFFNNYLDHDKYRGITTNDDLPVRYFDQLVRFASIGPDEL